MVTGILWQSTVAGVLFLSNLMQSLITSSGGDGVKGNGDPLTYKMVEKSIDLITLSFY